MMIKLSEVSLAYNRETTETMPSIQPSCGGTTDVEESTLFQASMDWCFMSSTSITRGIEFVELETGSEGDAFKKAKYGINNLERAPSDTDYFRVINSTALESNRQSLPPPIYSAHYKAKPSTYSYLGKVTSSNSKISASIAADGSTLYCAQTNSWYDNVSMFISESLQD